MLIFAKRFYFQTISLRNIAFVLLFGFVGAVSGPLGTFTSMGFAERLSLWSVSGALALLVIGFFSQLVAIKMPNATRGKHRLIVAFGFSMLFPILMTFLAETGLWATDVHVLGYWEIKVSIVLMVVALGLMVWLMDESQPEPELPRLYARLVDHGDARVVRLTVKDHYTEVYTSDGKLHRLLMRFADAVSEMDDADGFLVHRSHWVMRSEIESVFNRRGREFLELMDGTHVPVSKTYRPSVVAAGLL